jgi:hypothetical protein
MKMRLFCALCFVIAQTQGAFSNTISISPTGSPPFANENGLMTFQISNAEKDGGEIPYLLEVLGPDYKNIPLDQWRSTLTEEKDGQTIHLLPKESIIFAIQFRNREKYLICSTKEVNTLQARKYLHIIY